MKAKCYCPICKNEEFVDVDFEGYSGKRTKHLVNIRDGLGSAFLFHFPCSKCGSIMNATTHKWFDTFYKEFEEKERNNLDEYFKSVIDMYGIEDYGEDFRKWAKEYWEKIKDE
jgi:hypothetical protein